ncbi:MAG: hypothetical protein ACRDQC_05990 [Gaiellales bacterium]
MAAAARLVGDVDHVLGPVAAEEEPAHEAPRRVAGGRRHFSCEHELAALDAVVAALDLDEAVHVHLERRVDLGR